MNHKFDIDGVTNNNSHNMTTIIIIFICTLGKKEIG